jgi:hypothetical protein
VVAGREHAATTTPRRDPPAASATKAKIRPRELTQRR